MQGEEEICWHFTCGGLLLSGDLPCVILVGEMPHALRITSSGGGDGGAGGGVDGADTGRLLARAGCGGGVRSRDVEV